MATISMESFGAAYRRAATTRVPPPCVVETEHGPVEVFLLAGDDRVIIRRPGFAIGVRIDARACLALQLSTPEADPPGWLLGAAQNIHSGAAAAENVRDARAFEEAIRDSYSWRSAPRRPGIFCYVTLPGGLVLIEEEQEGIRFEGACLGTPHPPAPPPPPPRVKVSARNAGDVTAFDDPDRFAFELARDAAARFERGVRWIRDLCAIAGLVSRSATAAAPAVAPLRARRRVSVFCQGDVDVWP